MPSSINNLKNFPMYVFSGILHATVKLPERDPEFLPVTLSQLAMYLWLLVFWLQPHKGQLISEDFFLYSYYVSCNKNDSKHSIVLLLCLLSFLLHPTLIKDLNSF